MPRFLKNISKKTGFAPGTLIHVGERKSQETVITLFEYGPESAVQRKLSSIAELSALPPAADSIRWINIDGLHDIAVVEEIGKLYDIHPLTLEDIVNTGHRPKAEVFDRYTYTTIKMLDYDIEKGVTQSEQVSIVMCDRTLISFQEKSGDVFDMVRQRILKGLGRLRSSGSDYLLYALIDNIVDRYYLILEKIGEELERLEEQILDDPRHDLLERVHELKRETVYLRKQTWPLRDLISTLTQEEAPFIDAKTLPFFRDIEDHAVQIIEIIESYRDMLTGLIDLHMSGVGNRMNEVMKVLTIIATIFIPITFVAGVYGMNFKYMPELEWPWSYGAALGVMAVIAVIMILYFKKKRWW